MKKLFILLSMMFAHLCLAQDTVINVLGVVSGNANVTVANRQLRHLRDNWNTYQGVLPVNVVNNASAVSLTSQSITGSSSSQISSAKAVANWDALRATYKADLIIFFTGRLTDTSNICGRAWQKNWTSIDDPVAGQFNPDGGGLDLNGRDDSYYAIVGTDSANACNLSGSDYVALHELGHLFGAGHELTTANQYAYLYPESHALAVKFTLPYTPGMFYSSRTHMVTRDYDDNCSPPTCQVLRSNLFSYSGIHDNLYTVQKNR